MKTYDIVVLTDKNYLKENKEDVYKNTVFIEDEFVVNALKKEKLNVIRLAWDDKNFDWSSTQYVLLRTTWDYAYRFKEFSNWLKKVKKETILLNSSSIILWNIDKKYLAELEEKGIDIIPSIFIKKGTKTTLKQLINKHHSNNYILKPCVSAGAKDTHKISRDNILQYEAIFQSLIARENMILQPFQKSIVTKGEISLIIINGVFTHAILKKAKSGDFRVQDDFGGTIHEYIPSQEEIDFAQKVVKASPEELLYARVDICTDNNGNLALVELEAFEPELWFRKNPKAAVILAKGIKNKLNTPK